MRINRRLLCQGLLAGCLVVVSASCGKRTAIDPSVQDPIQAAEAAGKAAGDKPAKLELPGGGFQFPNVPGAQQLAELLIPSEEVTQPLDGDAGPRPRQIPRFLERPELPLPANDAGGVRVPEDDLAPIRPGLLPEEPPLSRLALEPALPWREELPARPGVRLAGADVEQPLPVPVLAQEAGDRASLESPSAEASTAATLAAQMPLRVTPTPFSKISIPEPFEHVPAVQLRIPPAENPTPPGDPPGLAKK